MAVSSLDSEFNKYWPLLTTVQKESLLSVIKSFIQPDEEINIEQYNKEIDEAISRVKSGTFFTQEEVEQLSKKW
jgi:hypothetical protein